MYVQVPVSVLFVIMLAWTVVSEDSCHLDQTCSASFVNSDIHLMGCLNVAFNVSPRSVASLKCLENLQCKAIICSFFECSTCTGDQILSLTFNSSSTTYIKRKVIRLNMGYDPVTLGISNVIELPDRLTPGDLVYVRATVLKFDSFLMDFMVDELNTNFHFRTRCNDECSDIFNCTESMCAEGNKYMKLTEKVNGSWSLSPIIDPSYPFKLNQQFELHFLVQSQSILCYIDRNHYVTYMMPFLAQSVYAIRVRGTVNFHEFSV